MLRNWLPPSTFDKFGLLHAGLARVLVVGLCAFLLMPWQPAVAETVVLPKELTFPVKSGDQQVGEVTLPVGTSVQVVGRQGNQVALQFRNFQTIVDASFLGEPAPSSSPAQAPGASPAAAGHGDDLGFAQHIQPILQAHCVSCHGPETSKGNVRFDQFTDAMSILEQRSMWLRTLDVLEFEEMPPDPAKTHFRPQHAEVLTDWIQQRVEPVDERNPLYADPGPTVIRQLTATEYERSIKEVLGIEFDLYAASGVHDEYAEYVYTNNARSLDMDATTFERYFEAATEVLAQFFSDETGSWVMANPNLLNKRWKEAAEARADLLADKEQKPEREAARDILREVATRAFRRPVSDEHADRFLAIYDGATAAGLDFEGALQKAMHPILASPAFLFRMESRVAPEGEMFATVDPYELAARLSYFLWAAPPDETLMQLAEEGRLQDPEVLSGEVSRMLKDPRAETLSTVFANQWTQLHHLEKALPEKRHFSAWSDTVKLAMHEEVLAFFNYLREEDRPVTDLIHADYTFANQELAALYGVKGVKGEEFQKVNLPTDGKRGGLVGMGAFLAMTSHTNRTKPTARGKWILDVMFGTPPPPPPANVEALEDQAAEDPDVAALTFRQQLDRHAADPACRTCHDRIDPLGFALENFNGIGEWREKDGELPVDNTGSLPGGRKLAGVTDLKQILLEDPNAFTANFVRNLMTYALGRDLVFTDELAVKQITEHAAANDYRFSAVIEGIIQSRQFQMKRTQQYDGTMAKSAQMP